MWRGPPKSRSPSRLRTTAARTAPEPRTPATTTPAWPSMPSSSMAARAAGPGPPERASRTAATSTPARATSTAAAYAESLLVNTTARSATRTAYRLAKACAAEASITPGRSLSGKTIGRSWAPVASTTSRARTIRRR